MTQAKCKKKFVEHMKKAIRFYDRIDQETPVSSPGNLTEPNWWLDMMDLRRNMKQIVDKYEEKSEI